MIYIVIYFVLLSAEVLSLRGRLPYYISLFGLFSFAAFRYQVGCDWTGYLNIYELAKIKEITLQTQEVAFWTTNKLLYEFEFDYPYINVIASILFFAGLHTLASRQPNPIGVLILAFPILILDLAMSGIRQAIAVGLFCFACNAFVDRRLLRFTLFVLLGATFHSSIMFFLILVPLVRGEYSLRRIALGMLLALPGLYYFLTSAAFEMYSQRYIGTQSEAFGAPFRTGLLAFTGAIFLCFLDHKWKVQSISDYKLVKICSYMMIATFPLCLYSSIAGDRIAFYFIPVQLVILTRLPQLFKGKQSSQIAFSPYAAGGLFLVTWSQMSSLFEGCYGTYQTWWSNV